MGAAAFCGDDRTLRVKPCAGNKCCAGKSSRIGQRLKRAGPLVEQGTGIGAAADPVGCLAGVEQAHRRAAPEPLHFALPQLLQASLADGAVQGSVALQLAIDAVTVDDVNQFARSRLGTDNRAKLIYVPRMREEAEPQEMAEAAAT